MGFPSLAQFMNTTEFWEMIIGIFIAIFGFILLRKSKLLGFIMIFLGVVLIIYVLSLFAVYMGYMIFLTHSVMG